MEQSVGLWFSTTSPRMRNLFLWIHLCLSPKSAPWFVNPSGNQPDLQHEIQANGQIPHPLWVVIKCPPSQARKGVKCPGYAWWGWCWSFDLTGTLLLKTASCTWNYYIDSVVSIDGVLLFYLIMKLQECNTTLIINFQNWWNFYLLWHKCFSFCKQKFTAAQNQQSTCKHVNEKSCQLNTLHKQ